MENEVIEIGCGSGLVTLGIAQSVRHIKAYDISEKMLAIARLEASRQHCDNVEFLQGDAYALPESDSSFDVALYPYVLDIVEQPEIVLKEAHRVLKENGFLISVTDCYQDVSPISSIRLIARELRQSIRRAMRQAKLRVRKKSLQRDTEFIRLTNDAGFRIIESEIIDIGAPNQFNLYLKAAKF